MARRELTENTTRDQNRFWNHRRRAWRNRIAATVAVALLGGAYWSYRDGTTPNHFRAVVPGVLYRSAWPTASQLAGVVRKHGIRTVVNLCLEDEELSTLDGNWDRELEQCQDLGVAVVHIPLPGNSPPSEAQIDEWLSVCTSPERQPVLVHCAQGVIRTNGMVAAYQIGVLGMGNRHVMAGLPAFGHHLFKPKRKRLNDFILSWRPEQVAGISSRRTSSTVAQLPEPAQR